MYDHEVNKFAKTVASFMLYDHDVDFKKGNPEFIDLIHLSNDSEEGDISEDEIKDLVNELNEFMFTEIDDEELYTNFTASSIDKLVSLINDTYSFDCIHEFDVWITKVLNKLNGTFIKTKDIYYLNYDNEK